jgi:hypothetical protein
MRGSLHIAPSGPSKGPYHLGDHTGHPKTRGPLIPVPSPAQHNFLSIFNPMSTPTTRCSVSFLRPNEREPMSSTPVTYYRSADPRLVNQIDCGRPFVLPPRWIREPQNGAEKGEGNTPVRSGCHPSIRPNASLAVRCTPIRSIDLVPASYSKADQGLYNLLY